MSWSIVGAVVFATASLIAFDLGWRLVKLPFEKLLIGGVLIDLAAAAALLAIVRVAVRGRWPQ
jgi:hypothetical protein